MATAQREYVLVRRTRYFAFVACRVGAILLIIFGSIEVVSGLLLYLRARSNYIPGFTANEADAYWFLYGLVKLVPGIILASATEGISKWIAPAPEFRCLRCDYDAARSNSDRCPECGAPMGVEFAEQQPRVGAQPEPKVQP